MSNGNKGKCPMCGAAMQVPTNAEVGDLVYCDQCDAELEVVSLKPLELDWPLDDYEDYDLEDEDDFDYEYEEGDDDYDDDFDLDDEG
jgi:lysine biosynthesis protein LysW